METIVWKAPATNTFIVPVACKEDTPLQHLVYWQYYPEKYDKYQITLVDDLEKPTRSEVFNIIGWINKTNVEKVPDFLARQCLDKTTRPSGELVTGDYLVKLLQHKRPEFSKANYIVFYELERITNDETQE